MAENRMQNAEYGNGFPPSAICQLHSVALWRLPRRLRLLAMTKCETTDFRYSTDCPGNLTQTKRAFAVLYKMSKGAM
jgi:hypothetical protein